MPAVQIITLLALLQFIFFAVQVGTARVKYGVKAPAVTGNAMFERYYRVQMNTLELLVTFVPALWLAASHVRELWIVVLGGIYLIGRMVYWRSYLADPDSRSLGFGLSILPILVLIAITLVGAGLQLARS